MTRRSIVWIIIIVSIVVRVVTSKPSYNDGSRVRISAKVTSEPIKYSDSQRLILSGLRFYLPLYPEISYGDYVVVEGIVEEDKLNNPILKEHRKTKGVLYQTRKNIIEIYNKVLPEPHSSLISGVTLGSKSAIPEKFWKSLKITGTMHVVVASGMNVTLVAGFLINIFVNIFERRRAIVFTLLGIWVYAVIAGFDAPIIRAAIMGSLVFSAQKLGKLYHAWRGLLLSAAAMLIIRPDWISDLGFILSFVATGSLMLFERKVRDKIRFIPEILREGFSTSLAAQIGVAPILFVTFGQFNIFSPVINALVLWTIAPMTIIGMVGGIVSLLSIHLGKLIILTSYPLTYWFVYIVEMFGK